MKPLTVQNLADREDAEKAIHFVTSPVGDQPLYLLPMVTTDELDDLHNLERPSSRQEVVHAAKDITQAEQQHESLDQYLAVEGDTVAAPIPIPPQSQVERPYVGSYRLNGKGLCFYVIKVSPKPSCWRETPSSCSLWPRSDVDVFKSQL